MPLDRHPGLDETGEFAAEGQSGPVWFLGPDFGGVIVRNAVIPPGKSLFITILSYEASTLEGLGNTVDELQSVAAQVGDLMQTVSCEVDRVAVGR